jgi:hypothetical protein
MVSARDQQMQHVLKHFQLDTFNFEKPRTAQLSVASDTTIPYGMVSKVPRILVILPARLVLAPHTDIVTSPVICISTLFAYYLRKRSYGYIFHVWSRGVGRLSRK